MRRGLALGALLLAGCEPLEPLRWIDCEEEPESEYCVDSDTDVPLDDVTGETDEPSETGWDTSGDDDTGGAAGVTVSPVTVTPSLLFNDSTASCQAQATALDGSPLAVTYAWSNETTLVGLGALPEVTLDPSTTSPGDTLRCTATASDGSLSASDYAEVEVGNRAPTVITPTIDPSTNIISTSSLTCSATATDPDGTTPTVTYAWSNETQGSSLGSGSARTLTAGTVSPGDVVRCTATASDGTLTASEYAQVEVEEPRPDPGDGSPHPLLGTLRYLPAGEFVMGCEDPRDVAGGLTSCSRSDELPTRTVTLTTAFEMMESELTQAQWTGLGFTNPSDFSGSTKPVERVNWWEALAAANEASRRGGLAECYTLSGCSGTVGDDWSCTGVTVTSASGHPKDCAGWRLPTEAEWEYAARAGTSFPYSGGSDVDQVAWYGGNNSPSGSGTKAVCTTPTPRNAWGLCDMSGNVWEWTWDGSADDYADAATTDPTGPASESDRVFRGGYWLNGAQSVRVAYRFWSTPSYRFDGLGFRLVRSVP